MPDEGPTLADGIAHSPARPRHVRPWLWGLLYLPFGVTSGFVSVTLAYILSQRGLPDSTIAGMVALNLLPLPTFDGEVAWKALTLLRGREIPARRAILLEVVEREERDEAQAAARVKAEVEAELAELTRTHNERAEAQKTTSSR